MASVGENIIRLRNIQGIDQKGLAQRSGVPQSTLSEIEKAPNKRPQGETLRKLAEALGVSVDDLMMGNGPAADQENLNWFWRARFAALSSGQLWEYRGTPAADRCAWAIRQLLDIMPISEIAARAQLQVQHIQDLAEGKAMITQPIIDTLESKLDIPGEWITNGDPVADDKHLKKILKHRDGGTWLRVIADNMDWAPPELAERLLNAVKGQNQR